MDKQINAGTITCTYCRKKYVLNEAKVIWYNNQYYDHDCYRQFCEKFLKSNPEQIINDKAKLLDHISKTFDEDYINQKLSIDLAGLLRKNFTYQGILASVIYYTDIKKQKFSSEYGIGTVNLIYAEAKRYWQQYYDNKEKLDNQTVILNEEIVYVHLEPFVYDKRIDMSKL